MPRRTRQRREPTEDWQQLRLLAEWPEQEASELIRPIVLFGQSPAERAKQTGAAERTLRRRATHFDSVGMASLFGTTEPRTIERDQDRRVLPPHLRQLIVDLAVEYPALRPKELARICYIASGRRPSPHTIKRVLADGPSPSQTGRRYPPYHEITDPAEARLAIIRLHSEGWTVTSIAGYLATSRQTIYTILREGSPRAGRQITGVPVRSAESGPTCCPDGPPSPGESDAGRVAHPCRAQAPGHPPQPAHLRPHPGA